MASFMLILPAAIGRQAVLSTYGSMSTSLMSFHMQPALRITKLPSIKISQVLSVPAEAIKRAQAVGHHNTTTPVGLCSLTNLNKEMIFGCV